MTPEQVQEDAFRQVRAFLEALGIVEVTGHAYTEDQLVEQPAIGLFAELGWQTVSAMEEVFGRERHARARDVGRGGAGAAIARGAGEAESEVAR